MNHDPIALRVARRHQAAMVVRTVPTTKTRVEYTSGGTISSGELMKMLESTMGPIVKLRFRPTPAGPTTTTAWEALSGDGAIVTGQLVLHAAITESEVTSWAVVSVDRAP